VRGESEDSTKKAKMQQEREMEREKKIRASIINVIGIHSATAAAILDPVTRVSESNIDLI